MMYLIAQILAIFTSTQRTALPYLIIEMHYFKTIMTMVIRHTLSLVQDPELRDPDDKEYRHIRIGFRERGNPFFYTNSCCGIAMPDPQSRLLP